MQKLLGHASVATTQRYRDHLGLAELRQAAPDRLHEARLSVLDSFVVGEGDPVVQFLRGVQAPMSPRTSVTINFATLTPDTSYLPDEAPSVTVYPVRVVPEPDGATMASDKAQAQRSDDP